MLSGIVIAKNEERMIGDCLVSLEFCDEVTLVDSGSTDSTIQIAKEHGARMVRTAGSDYSQFRNDGLKAAKGNWVLYLDADERITPLLKNEILKVVHGPDVVYQIPRQNIYLGREMHYGGWGHDLVIRLFSKKLLKGYSGVLHEQPKFSGDLRTLSQSMTHFSHRDLSSMLEKTLVFTAYEAQLRLKTHHPQVTPWRFVRVMLTEFYYRFIKLSAWRDGVEGIIDGSFQVFNTFIIYARVWESQLKT